jgi:hypothetical protein
MYVSIQRGSVLFVLAGGDGQRSETSNLRISSETNFQQSAYIEAAEFVQFYRGGAATTVSFSSVLTFSTVAEAETYLLNTPQGLINQLDMTATLGRLTASGTRQVETLTCVGNASINGNINWALTAADGNASGSTAVLSGDTPTLYAPKIAASLNASAAFSVSNMASSSGTTVIITKRNAAADDGTFALVTTNGSPNPTITGATSANTTAGVAPTITNSVTLNDVSAMVDLSQQGVAITQNVTILGKYGS